MILVVDDDPSVLDWLSRAIEDEGHRVSRATSVGDALRLAKTFEFELGVLDFRLPDGDGCELFQRLRETSPQIAGILVTGFSTTSVAFACGKIGIGRILEKPVERSTLIAAVDEVLAQNLGRATGLSSFSLPAVDRLARAIVHVSEEESDFRQLGDWARRNGMSRGGVRELCYAAGVKPHDALAFARGLRAVLLNNRLGVPPKDLLDFSERRSLAYFLARAHIASSMSAETFCREQEFLSNAVLIDRILVLLGRQAS